MMKKTLFFVVTVALSTLCFAQNYNAAKVTVRDSIWLNGKWVKKVNTDASLSGAGDNEIPSTKAVKAYVDNVVIAAGSGTGNYKGFFKCSVIESFQFLHNPG
jgi:hypothetical protein